MVLRSEQFDDVYFSVDDGMAETRHVFFEGNNLPQAWDNEERFTIAETGFGTGLNFLTVWKLFEETADKEQRLDFISVEKFPLSKDQIAEALQPWSDVLGRYLDRLLHLYPIRIPGPHRLYISDRVTLTIWFGDIAEVLPEWNGCVDAWFLDGFTPAKNPEMWTDHLFQNMARLSHQKTSYATFTAAGSVRRGLADAGFSVEKVKGFGRKRDMIKGHFTRNVQKASEKTPSSVAIIGGGIAGTAAAYILNYYGVSVTLYEAGETLAFDGSGSRLGMINPKLTAKPTPHSDYYSAAYANVLRILPFIPDIDFQMNGSLHLCTSEDKARRFKGYYNNLGWNHDHIRYEGDDCLYPEGANICPFKACHALAKDIDVRLNSKIESLDQLSEDIVILANSFSVTDIVGDVFPIHSVRGQVSWVKPHNEVNRNICFGGYITPQTPGGFHVLGSTFQPWDNDEAVRESDHLENLERYNDAMGQSLGIADVVGGWTAFRSASKDRFPIVGKISQRAYVSVAHGSHGIISSFMAGEIIASQILGRMIPATQAVLKALDPKRFHKS